MVSRAADRFAILALLELRTSTQRRQVEADAYCT